MCQCCSVILRTHLYSSIVYVLMVSGLKGYQRVGHRDLARSTSVVHWTDLGLANSSSTYTD